MKYNYAFLLIAAEVFFNDNYHFVMLNFNGQGVHFSSDNDGAYHLAIDSDNSIQALPESEIVSALISSS